MSGSAAPRASRATPCSAIPTWSCRTWRRCRSTPAARRRYEPRPETRRRKTPRPRRGNAEAAQTGEESHLNGTRYIPLPKVARQLGLSFERALHLVRTHQLPGQLVGGARWFVRAEDLARYQLLRGLGSRGRAA